MGFNSGFKGLTILLKLFIFRKALIRRAGRHTNGKGEKRNAYRVMVGKLDGKEREGKIRVP